MTSTPEDNDLLDAFGGISLAEAKHSDVYEDIIKDDVEDEDEGEDEEEEFASASGNLFMMNDIGELDLKGENVTMILLRKGDFDYELRLWRGEIFIFNQPVSNSMQLTFEKNSHAIEWISFFGERILAWRFQFDDLEIAKEFKTSLSVGLMETSRQSKFSDIVKNKEEKKWIEDGYFEEDAKYQYEDEDGNASDYDEGDAFDFDSYEPRQVPDKTLKEQDTNKNLNISKCRNRTFVFNGKNIGVFKHDDDDQLELVNKINSVYTRDGNEFSPSHTMLHETDEKMLMLNPDCHDKVYVMDLHRGDVVEEWQAGSSSNFNIRNFAPMDKYAQLTTNKVIAGVSYNGLFYLDPRVGGKNKMTNNYFYQSNSPKFSCLATNGAGNVVVGSHTGEIRLFNGVTQKRAKTKLPGLGDGITGIDVTENGKWILATTQNYLLLLLTAIEGDSKRRTGFQVGMGKKKRRPIKLQLSHTDMVKYNIDEVNFQSASFNTGEGITEEWIVTSTGPYLITWNFMKLKKHGLREYKIKRTGKIIEAKFRYGKKDNVVVNMPHDIYTEKMTIR